MDNLEQFKKAAVGLGYNPQEVESFASLIKSKPTYDPGTDPTLQRQIAYYKATNPSAVDTSGNIIDPVKQVYKENGQDLLKGYATAEERRTAAQNIVEFGGVNAYRQQAPLTNLLSGDKKVADKYSALGYYVSTLENVASYFPKEIENQVGFSSLSGPEVALKRSLANNIFTSWIPGIQPNADQVASGVFLSKSQTEKMKELSGVAISDQEARRMEQWLPTMKDSESVVAAKTDALLRASKMNLEVIEQAARNNLTPTEYLEKNKSNLYLKYGFNSDGSDVGTKQQTSSKMSTTPNLQRDQIVQKLKGAGYSDAQITQYLQAKGIK